DPLSFQGPAAPQQNEPSIEPRKMGKPQHGCPEGRFDTKYNVLTFLPLNLYEQFHRMANLYFLFIILLQVRSHWRQLGCSLQGQVLACGEEGASSLSLRPFLFCLLLKADLLLLCSSEPSSLCYVETADIDGKPRSVSLHPCCWAPGKVTCEEPNSRMHNFIGTLEWKGQKYSLDSEKILLRGCRIRNTETCYGLVIYAGDLVELCTVPKDVVLLPCFSSPPQIFLMLVVTSFCLAIAAGFWITRFRTQHSYLSALYARTSIAQQAFFAFWGFMILLKWVLYFIDWDLKMYYPVKDTPAKARSTSLNDQLGQIEYIFSDKTGTLTQNIMTFKKCCINGIIYGNSDRSWNPYVDRKAEFHNPALLEAILRNDDPVTREFLRLLALCHTVMVEEKESQLVYQAASPDEEALVTAARNLGYVFLSRTQDTITVSELGTERTYQVLAMLDFNSVRKRMSVLVRDPEGKIQLYTKGADVVILERLREDGPNKAFTQKALDRFAEETLRTLCLACKEVKEEDYAEWSKRHHEASVLLQNRAQELDNVYEAIEQDLQLLGATAIEDKLQDRVPETIHLLKNGNIKVWVLTGDKQETAVNIGFACRLLSDDMEILEEKEPSPVSLLCSQDKVLCTGEKVKKKEGFWARLACCKARTQQEAESSMEKAFVDLATSCQAVICCRVTPKQKAFIVQLVKRHRSAITLAIGDGANDVNMIKTADIGVGISGQEGMQAVQCSDYALAQFYYLQRLLFVHGRWSYLRICKFLRYFFYKTFSSMIAPIWFAFYSGFTAQPLYEPWYFPLYNVFYTAYPVLTMGLTEQDVSAKKSLQFPELYKVGQKDKLFNYRVFCMTLLHGILSSLGSFYIALWAFEDRVGSRTVGDYQSFAITVGTSAFLTAIAEVRSGPLYASQNALTDPYVLCIILLSVVVNIIPSLTVRTFCSITGTGAIQDNIRSKDLSVAESTVELQSHFRRGSLRRHSSYAFSHKEGYADLITRGASLRGKDSRNRSRQNSVLPAGEDSTPSIVSSPSIFLREEN
uniref:Phospholipid-transporting ATPase n=1 Tax=Pelusios castaneus TaxID=367368 RepID=A0A8C8RVK1_9SAUR